MERLKVIAEKQMKCQLTIGSYVSYAFIEI